MLEYRPEVAVFIEYCARGVKSELIVVTGGWHGFGGKDARKAAKGRVGWLEKHLLKAGQKGGNKLKD